MSRPNRPTEAEVYPRALPPENIELANIPLDGFNNVNLYEIIPLAQPVVAEPPASAVPLSPVRN